MKRIAWKLGTWGMMAAAAALTGCASISEEQCRLADSSSWERLGRSDAQAGMATTRLNQHQEACAKVGVLPDDRAYIRGWSQGVLEYCTPHNAREVGRKGASSNSQICPGDSGRLFQANWVVGRNIYEADQDVSRLQNEVRDLQYQSTNKKVDAEAQRSALRRIPYKETELQMARMRLLAAQSVPMVLK